MNGAKFSDELWVEVICQSNQEIAGSPRNAFRRSLECSVLEVGLWLGSGANRLPTPSKPRMPVHKNPGVRQRGLSFVVERETAQTLG